MKTSRSIARLLVPALGALAVAGGVAATASADTPVPPGGPDDVNGNGILDSSETPDNPDAVSPVSPVSPGLPFLPGGPDDVNGNGVLDSSETPDNPDL